MEMEAETLENTDVQQVGKMTGISSYLLRRTELAIYASCDWKNVHKRAKNRKYVQNVPKLLSGNLAEMKAS